MNNYWKYAGKKALWYFITLIVALLLNFILPRLIPGNPVDALVANSLAGITDASTIARIRNAYLVEFGLDKPMWQQFFIYVGKLFKGDMGISFSQYPRSVSDILAGALPWTLRLQIPAILVGWFLGNVLGAITGYRKKVWDKVIFPVFLFIAAIPVFGLGIVLVYYFANILGWFPGRLGYAFDMYPNWSNPAFILSMLNHYRLPFLTMVLVAIGGQSLGMREMSIYELNADYVKYSRLMGVKDKKIVWYVFRNAMLPQITGLALSLGTMIGGNVVAEIVFSYPGIGTTLLNGISLQDFPLISGCTLIISITVLIANFLVDLLLGVIDPRIRMNQSEEEG
ncbi:MAG: ABC transporter permease [Spirochaetaceae bacterium]|jgi:peptide/nickel transport system permease protein|nr:ABC transporter permease [Spirochaetaceae bacterium]